MKILAFTDIHGSKKAIEKVKTLAKRKKPDFYVCCGDVSIFEMDIERTLKRLNALKKEVLIVPGNHEGETRFKKLCKKYPRLTNIHHTYAIRENYLFLGYGGDGFSFVDPVFKKLTKKFEKIIAKHKDKKVVLVTHAPPYKTKLDKLIGGYCGNKTIRQFIEKKKPAVALCGHIHENFGTIDKIKKTKVINPGPYGCVIHLTE